MKKFILYPLILAIGLVGSAFTASAHEEDEDAQPIYQPNGQQPVYQQYRQEAVYQQYDQRPRYDGRERFDDRSGGRQLDYEVDHLNRMLAHVGRSLRTYRADRHIWREYQHLRAEAYQLNNQFRRGVQYYNPRRLRAQIQHMHDELHHIEQELHVRANDYYRW